MSTFHELKVTYEKLERGELSPEELADLEEALDARNSAHAPYSNFLVGACLRTNDGTTVQGWNVENIGYAALHAEEGALGRIPKTSRLSGLKRATVAGGPRDQDSEEIVTSCGDCRQAMLEILRSEDDPQIIMAGIRGKVIRASLRELLPLGFFPACVVKR